jgi:hypothetical protein
MDHGTRRRVPHPVQRLSFRLFGNEPGMKSESLLESAAIIKRKFGEVAQA